MSDKSETPRTDAMQRITFEGCECIVAAPEDIEQLERELAAAAENVLEIGERLKKAEAERDTEGQNDRAVA